MHISTRQITSKKVRGNNVDFWTSKITAIKVRGNNVDFSTIEITSKRVGGSNVDFSTSEITSKKVHGNDVDFSTIEITSKKYVQMTWKFVEIWSSMYQRNITSNRRRFDVVFPLGQPVISTRLDPYMLFYEKWEIITEIFDSLKIQNVSIFYFWKTAPKMDKFFNFLPYIQRVTISVLQN